MFLFVCLLSSSVVPAVAHVFCYVKDSMVVDVMSSDSTAINLMYIVESRRLLTSWLSPYEVDSASVCECAYGPL